MCDCAVDSEKMSKSLGNFFTIRDVTAQYHPLVLRWFLLNTQYRQAINYSQPALDEVYTCAPFVQVYCPALPCRALPCSALPCPALPCPALPCPACPALLSFDLCSLLSFCSSVPNSFLLCMHWPFLSAPLSFAGCRAPVLHLPDSPRYQQSPEGRRLRGGASPAGSG